MVECVDPRHCHVALLVGGASGEREVSLASGDGARQALEEAGFRVTVLDPAVKNDLKALIDGSFDVAFICLHGKYGEDGTLQGLLEMIGLPYIGSGVWSSSLAIDKAKSKVFYKMFDIPVPPSITLHANAPFNIDDLLGDLGEHCVVKPATEGSALGVFIVEGKDEIQKAIEKVWEFDDEILVERYIDGKELTVAVIGNEDPRALPIIEIVPVNEFYDYESKYTPGASQHICPARLSDETTELVQELAVKAHLALDCSGVSRSDFILDNDGACWILETNTIPGMTGTSLLPDAARAAGISFAELCTMLIGFALEKR
ncbi:D-alanine--D-alanine ligase [Gordonibacter sp. 28C]|uniref:D-alanine--D-alanine ligase family protein n=1 Tax=Gordonibacter sp. 28C TaxID=2078569 RepID=UPI000DF86A51|nr:D-alanine--D-alanine ligase [Gordonibacter sp. 28C]RDB58790.1 D-alanine--D-alanine ligase [Gordonibacter sp. 28C]